LDYSDQSEKSEVLNTSTSLCRAIAMVKKSLTGSCMPSGGRLGCCQVESVISVDERGQMVLPKDLRSKAGIRVGDKLAVISLEKDGKVFCISLVKVDNLTEMVRDMLGPLFKEIAQK
jgi:antitoxin PrlF